MSEGGVFLFGAGGAASWVLSGFKRSGVHVRGFLDEAACPPAVVCGLPVFSPADPRISATEREQISVVVAVMNPKADFPAIIARLTGHGWRHALSLADFGKRELAMNGLHCGMLAPEPFLAAGRELAAVRNLLVDKVSQAVLDGFVRFVQVFDDSGLPPITPLPYFPPDLPRWKEPLRMIDCGAFDGDTLIAADVAGYQVEASASFEPDPLNYKRLATVVRNRPGAEAWPCGVSGKTEILRFAAQGDTGSALDERGDLAVQCVTLDDALPWFTPTLIKMDVEGAEEEALKGAEQILRHNSPGLAISVYHHPEHIWRIPLWLTKILTPGSRYFLRRHSHTVADTVLYVMPPS